ncbi:MAG: autotransporter-associated beta strand repeat-containing protein [Pirellulales bacterium]|nr:autotransporter-associated beta strand repeat-containing protein [Pirellulales bacterium]
MLAASAVLTLAMLPAASAYDLHFDYTSFETGFGQSQFNVLNYPSINGNYMMTSTDNHRPEMVANGNALAQFYNNFNADYNHPTAERRTPTEEAAHIDAYTRNNSTKNGARPEWLILNEISSSQWQLNPGAPSLSEHRTWVIDTVTLLNDVYGYKVVTYSPYETVGTANAASWQALAAKSYIGIESYQSGTEVWNSGANNASRLAWVQGKYQSSKNTYMAAGVSESRLFISEHFANNAATYVDNQGNTRTTGWGRAGLASASDWDQVIMIRQDAMLNVGFAGFLAYNWGGNGLGVTQAEQIQHEYYYRSRRVLPSQKPQWLSNAAINVNGTTIPLSWSQPLNWLGGFPNANGAEANFWRTLTDNRTITLDGSKTIGKLTFDSSFSYTISPGTGGNLVFSNAGSAATLTSNQGAHVIGVNVQLAGNLSSAIATGTVTIYGTVSGAGALTKSGAGALILNGANTYTGATTLSAGALRVANMLNTPGGAISIAAGGILEAVVGIPRVIVNNGVVAGPAVSGPQLRLSGPVSGVGDFTGNVAFAGGFSPGVSATAVMLGNGLFEPGNTLSMQIGGLAEGLQYDHLDVSGTLSLGGELAVSLINNFTPQPGDSFNLLDWTIVSGVFHTITLPTLSGLVWDDSQLYSHGVLSVLSSADFNGDGAVDATDLASWKGGFGASGNATHTQGDADGDRDVDGVDFLAWQRQLGAAPSVVSANTPIPEPATSSLVVLASVGIRRIGRRLRQELVGA